MATRKNTVLRDGVKQLSLMGSAEPKFHATGFQMLEPGLEYRFKGVPQDNK